MRIRHHPGWDLELRDQLCFAAATAPRQSHGRVRLGDSTDADFASTRDNEFNLRAAGGVRIQSNRGIALNDANAPLITRATTPSPAAATPAWAAGTVHGVFALAIGIAELPGRHFEVANTRPTAPPCPCSLGPSWQPQHPWQLRYISDRNAKENFKAVDSRDVLENVAALPIARWNFKQEAACFISAR